MLVLLLPHKTNRQPHVSYQAPDSADLWVIASLQHKNASAVISRQVVSILVPHLIRIMLI